MLHILNGDCTKDKLRDSTVGGTMTVWADVLHDGPSPGGVSAEEWRDARARFHAAAGDERTVEEARRTLEEWDAAIDTAASHDEVVMWFEHDLFDQLILIRLLDRFADTEVGPASLSLICIDHFPGVERFVGLGQLTAPQLASLLPSRRAVTKAQLVLGRAAWRAFCAPDPSSIEALLGTDTSALPHVAPALCRHLQQFPSTANGLSRTEQQSLSVVSAAGGRLIAGDLFRAVSDMEERQFLGDWSLWRYLVDLAGGPRPLLSLDTTRISPEFRHQTVAITDTGRTVLGGHEDWVAIRGIDRWYGGVHLQGADAAWRWDQDESRLRGRPPD